MGNCKQDETILPIPKAQMLAEKSSLGLASALFQVLSVREAKGVRLYGSGSEAAISDSIPGQVHMPKGEYNDTYVSNIRRRGR